MRDLIWQPYFPLPSVIGSALVVAILAAVVYGRACGARPVAGALLLAMRLMLVAAVTVLLLGPSVRPSPSSAPGRSTLHILLDTSASMQTADVTGQPRYEVAAQRWLSDAQLEALGRQFNVTLIGFDTAPRRIEPDMLRQPATEVAVGSETNLAEALRQTVDQVPRNGPSSAVLLLSDGRDTDDRSTAPAANHARARDLPVHTVALGGPNLQHDLMLTARSAQPYLLVGEPGSIVVRVVQTNGLAARTTLHLRHEGDGHLTRPITFESDQAIELELPIEHERPGLYRYDVSVDPISHERNSTNNAQPLFVKVTGQRLKVLLLEGQPYWDTRFLSHAMRRDERISLHQITQFSASRREQIVTRVDSNASVPKTLAQLQAYDVIILGRNVEHVLPAETLELLPDYVGDHGGRLILARGQPYSMHTSAGRVAGHALSVLEPVIWGQGALREQLIRLTTTGRRHPSFTALDTDGVTDVQRLIMQLPALEMLPRIIREKTGAQVLARTRSPHTADGNDNSNSQPAIVTMPYGRGMVLAVLGEGLWKWRLTARDEPALRSIFDRFWSNQVRWLAMGSDFQPGELISLRVNRHMVDLGEPVTLEIVRRLRHVAPKTTLTVIGPDDTRSEVQPSARDTNGLRHSATYQPTMPGVYTATLAAPSLDKPRRTHFAVHGVDEERLRAGSNPAALRRLAEATGGHVLNPHHPEKLLEILERADAARDKPAQPQFIWNRAWVMWLVLGWMGAEWLIRRTGGLL